jgi:cytochrome c peroxidase
VARAFGEAAAARAQDRFGRLWGQALQAYQATLVPDQTPLDRFLEGDAAALTAAQKQGLEVFKGKADCARCHAGPALSDASTWFAQENGLVNEDGGDQGYHNIGVRPTEEDLGRAAAGPSGAPFAETDAAANRGAFKTPGLRNVALTPPYFHNGTKGTLLDVLAFYIRGGDFENPELATGMVRLQLTTDEHNALLDFLENALTDCRVKLSRAPFDHPSLAVPNGPSLPAEGAVGSGICP